MRATSLLFLLVLVAGCSGLSYAMNNYSGVRPVSFNDGAKTWRVFDKPHEGRLMITSSIGDAMSGGAAKGFTFGLAGPVGGPEGNFERGAQSFLDASGRKCSITGGALVVEPQYEFFYTCGAA